MGDTLSYFDIHTEPERVFQAYVLGLLGILGDDYIIRSNRESGSGRYDILLLPHDRSQYGVVMEIKQLKKEASEEQIQQQLREALNVSPSPTLPLSHSPTLPLSHSPCTLPLQGRPPSPTSP